MGTPKAKMALQPDPSSCDRANALYMAKLSEQAERYDDMVKYMKRIVSLGVKGDELSVEERNLLSVGYKNMMSVRRTAWRTVQQYHKKNQEDGNQEAASQDSKYGDHISQEVFALINEVVSEIVNVYVNGDNKCEEDKDGNIDSEVVVFFKKMEGDYNRYGAEITEGSEKKAAFKNAAFAAYESAQEQAKSLPSTNPIRLGLALNFSVFHYEICEQKREASDLAKEAFDTAIDHLDTLADDEYKDSTLIMQLLKDNLTLWNNDQQTDEEADDIQVEDVQ